MPKKRIIDIEAHALFRVLERGSKFGLDYYETKERAFSAVKLGKLAKRKHLSKEFKTYYNYFNDNLSFYVICQENEFDKYVKCLIRTVIIEEGRQ
ncbi:hypothetical protein J4209_03780 [Candidatus Woesearchaeota archaeon]|nr:hypothetical protein [Candidatus Woesearchaeota archaeon]